MNDAAVRAQESGQGLWLPFVLHRHCWGTAMLVRVDLVLERSRRETESGVLHELK